MNSPIFNDMPLIIENKGPFAPQVSSPPLTLRSSPSALSKPLPMAQRTRQCEISWSLFQPP